MNQSKLERNTPRSSVQFSKEQIVDDNFSMLKGSMKRLLLDESFGGNAGTEEIGGVMFPCAAANGYANHETGRIAIFGNIQNIPASIVERNVPFTLRAAIEVKTDSEGPSFRIIKIVSFLGSENFTQKAKNAIQAAIKKYNSRT